MRSGSNSRHLYALQEPCYYSLLDVDPKASATTISKAYRLLALKYHPDKNPTAEPDHFQSITEAYRVLSDPEQRRLYDIYGPSLRPHMGETFAKAAPALLSLVTGVAGSTLYRIGTLPQFRLSLFLQCCCVGVSGFYYCYAPRAKATFSTAPSRDVVSISDYMTISCLGLLIGNVVGFTSASVLLFVRSFLSSASAS